MTSSSRQNGMEDFKNGMKDNLPYFHTNSILDFVHGIYRENNILTKAFNILDLFNILHLTLKLKHPVSVIYACYFFTNRSTSVVRISQIVFIYHHCKYIALRSNLQYYTDHHPLAMAVDSRLNPSDSLRNDGRFAILPPQLRVVAVE